MSLSPNSYVEVLTPSEYVCIFGDIVLKEEIKLKSLGWNLTQPDLCSYRKGLGLRCVQREEPMKTQGEDNHLKAKDRSLRRHQPCPPLGFRVLAPKTVRKSISLVEGIHSSFHYDSTCKLMLCDFIKEDKLHLLLNFIF